MRGEFGGEPQAPGAGLPQSPGGVAFTPPTGGLWDTIKRFLSEHFAYVKQVPFKFMTVEAVTLPAAQNTWLDQSNKQQRRRAFAVTNNDPTAGNDIWVAHRAMTAVGQGGFILAQGGVLYVPGSADINVHVWPTAVGTVVSFWQFG